MQIGSPTTAPDFFAIAGDHRASGQRKSAVLLTGTVGRPDNFRLAYQQPIAGQEWDAPRHHHDFEQIRFVLDGDITIAKGQKIKVIVRDMVGSLETAARIEQRLQRLAERRCRAGSDRNVEAGNETLTLVEGSKGICASGESNCEVKVRCLARMPLQQ